MIKNKTLLILASSLLLAACAPNAPVASSADSKESISSIASSESASSESSSPSSEKSSESSAEESISSEESIKSSEESSESSEAVTKYTISIVESPLATLTADKTSAEAGETITVTSTLADKAYLPYIKVNSETVYETSSYSGVFTFTMPEEAVRITYEAKQGYQITLNTTHAIASVVTSGIRDNVLCEGWNVLIEATPDDGYHITSVTAVTGSGSSVSFYRNEDGQYTFLMPGDSVTFTVVAEEDNPIYAEWANVYKTGIAITGSPMAKEAHSLSITKDGSVSFTPAGYEMTYEASSFTVEDGVLVADTSTLAEPSSLRIEKYSDHVVHVTRIYTMYSREYRSDYVLADGSDSFILLGAYSSEQYESALSSKDHLAVVSSSSAGVFACYSDYRTSGRYPRLSIFNDGTGEAVKTALVKGGVYSLRNGEQEVAAVKYGTSTISSASAERGTYKNGSSTLVLDGFETAVLDGVSHSYVASSDFIEIDGVEKTVKINKTDMTFSYVEAVTDPFLNATYVGSIKDYTDDSYWDYSTYDITLTFSGESGKISLLKSYSSDWSAYRNGTKTDVTYTYDEANLKITFARGGKTYETTYTVGAAKINFPVALLINAFYYEYPAPSKGNITLTKQA